MRLASFVAWLLRPKAVSSLVSTARSPIPMLEESAEPKGSQLKQ